MKVYINYDSNTGEIIGTYAEDCIPFIPNPNVEYDADEYNQAKIQHRSMKVDVSKHPHTLLIGEMDTDSRDVVQYSKLQLIRQMKKIAINGETLWSYVKQFIDQNDMTDEWDACTYIASNDIMFKEVKNKIKKEFPDVNVYQILKKCYY